MLFLHIIYQLTFLNKILFHKILSSDLRCCVEFIPSGRHAHLASVFAFTWHRQEGTLRHGWKTKKIFYEISDGLLYLLTVKLAPPNYYLKFRYLPQNFQKKSNLNAKPIALPNHLSYVRILLVGVCWLNLFLPGSNIHWVSPSHVFLVCWVIWTQVATLPTISLQKNSSCT